MQIEIGIVLIVIGFLIPVAGFFVIRKIRQRFLQNRGEIFEKDCDSIFDVEEEGNRQKIIINNRQVSYQQQSILARMKTANLFKAKPKDQAHIIFFHENLEKRKLKNQIKNDQSQEVPNVQDISIDPLDGVAKNNEEEQKQSINQEQQPNEDNKDVESKDKNSLDINIQKLDQNSNSNEEQSTERQNQVQKNPDQVAAILNSQRLKNNNQNNNTSMLNGQSTIRSEINAIINIEPLVAMQPHRFSLTNKKLDEEEVKLQERDLDEDVHYSDANDEVGDLLNRSINELKEDRGTKISKFNQNKIGQSFALNSPREQIHNNEHINQQRMNHNLNIDFDGGGDRSFLAINADLSDIMGNNSRMESQQNNNGKKNTPAFQQGVINFYEQESEDLSMLKEIISQGSNDDRSNMSKLYNNANNNKNTINDLSMISLKQPQHSPFQKFDQSNHQTQEKNILKNTHINYLNNNNSGLLHDKSTDCLNSKDSRHIIVAGSALVQSSTGNIQVAKQSNFLNKQLTFQQQQQQNDSNYMKNNEQNDFLQVNSRQQRENVQMLSNGDESSIDGQIFEEKIQQQEKQPYYKPANKQQDLTKQLFYQRNFKRPVLNDQIESQIQMITDEEDEQDPNFDAFNNSQVSLMSASKKRSQKY
eukprot:403348230